MGLWRRGSTSCGGSCRLLRDPVGWTAVSLPRDDDLDLVAAWLELDTPPASAPAAWASVTAHVARRDAAVLADRAHLLGLPVARVGEAAEPTGRPGVLAERLGSAPARSADLSGLLVVDLSALWAGPLCGDLLARAGASVVKVESTRRPDGARRGSRAFFDLLNGRKRSVALDLHTREGVRVLRDLVGEGRHRDRGQPSTRARSIRAAREQTSSARVAPGSGSPSPATGARATPGTGWPSATTPRPPVASWSGTTTNPCSAPTQWQTR